MVSKTDQTRLYSRLLAAAPLPLLLILVWWLHDSLAYVRSSTPAGVDIFWSSSEATLNLRLGCPPNGDLSAWGPCWDDAARDAAQQWNVSGAQFTFRIQSPSRSASVACDSSATDGITTVVWADTNCGMAFGDETLAITQNWFYSTGELIDSDVLFNTNKDWTTYSGPQRFDAIDFHRVAIHEFGHVLGLDHPDEHGQFVDAIMNSKTGNIDRLQTDDINGIRAIYGSDASRGQPDPDYCRDFGPCPAGKGDCDSNNECQSGLTCVNDVGARYGLPAHYDVCEAGGPDPNYCVYNYCGPGDGDCDPGQCDEGTCVNDVGARYGLPAHYDVCEAGGPDPDYCVYNYCGLGDGDCDPGQCDEGVCVNDVGARYGLPAHYDVCEAGGPDPNYCVYNYCGPGDGDCDPGQCDEGICVNDVGARYGLPAHYDVCEAGGPDPDYCVYNYCGLGDGDCDPGQCDEGVCVNDVGARYGLPAHYDVCEAGGSGSSLKDLLGTWRFTGRVEAQPYDFSYRLERIDTSTGTPLITGTDLSDNVSIIVAGRMKDIDATSILPYEYALLDAEPYVCGFFVFNKTGSNYVSGRLVLFEANAAGLCTTTIFGSSSPNGYTFTGRRTSRAASGIQEQSLSRDATLEQLNAGPQNLEETSTLGLSSHAEADSAIIRDMINMLSSTLD